MAKRIYGYCRISTPKQSIDRQIRNILKDYPDAIIYQEEFTGTKLDRPKWNALMRQVRPNDTIVFDSVSRMSRDSEEGFKVYEKLFSDGVNLVYLKEPHINTETYRKALETGVPLTGTDVDYILEGVNKYLMCLAKEQIKIAFNQSEKEVTDLRQRTREGIETARRNGKQIGAVKGRKLTTKKSVVAKEIIKTHCKSFGGTLSDAETMKLAGVTRNTYYKYKREIIDEYYMGGANV